MVASRAPLVKMFTAGIGGSVGIVPPGGTEGGFAPVHGHGGDGMTTEIILQTIISGLLMGFIYALVAAGLSLIFGLMEIVNFAHGEFMMLSMYAAFWLYTFFGLDPLLAIPICVALLFGLGVATHYGIIRHILDAPVMVQITATFGLAIFLRSLAQFLWTPDFRSIPDPIVAGRIEVLGIFLG